MAPSFEEVLIKLRISSGKIVHKLGEVVWGEDVKENTLEAQKYVKSDLTRFVLIKYPT